METLANLISKRIRELRKQKGFSQEDMESFGLNYKYYQKIEAGRVNMTLNTIEKVANAFGVDVREIFFLPLDGSADLNELAALIIKLLSKKNPESIRKLKVFINEIL